MKLYDATAKPAIIGRIEYGEDLFDALDQVARERKLQAAEIRALGALTRVAVTEWDHERKTYRDPLNGVGLHEVLMLYGNLSRRDGEPFWHCHVTAGALENDRTKIVAGHLLSATVYALEFVITPYHAPPLERELDEKTGLFLWK
ncbi:DUF296 domain-containing protein [bacterium]|nr:DUF296 domain-containing protein [bacterium]